MSNPGDREFMHRACGAAHRELPDGYCFILIAASPGEDQRLFYGSNMDRKTAIRVLKEWLIKAGEAEGWMKHLE